MIQRTGSKGQTMTVEAQCVNLHNNYSSERYALRIYASLKSL